MTHDPLHRSLVSDEDSEVVAAVVRPRASGATSVRGSRQSAARIEGNVVRDVAPRQCPHCHELFPGDFRVCPRDAVELVAPAGEDPLVGAVLNETYKIVRAVGEGGMGRVYEASHRRLATRTFAIKVMHRAHALQAEVVDRFRREAQTTAAIVHENVVEVFDVDTIADGIPYIVCEYLDGEDLGDALDRVGTLDEAISARVIRQVCRALQAAHDHGVIHRDMKPENIYITGPIERPFVKLLDFGIARVDDASKAMYTRTGVIMGTPAFMAPEQALGSRVDHRADIYAVGAILYRMLTGVIAHDREDPSETLGALLTEDPVRPRALQPRLSGAFELVIQRAMARDPEDRYGSMEQLENELAAFDPQSHELAVGHTGPIAAVSESSSGELAGTRPRGPLARASREAREARPFIAFALGLLLLSGYVATLLALDDLLTLVRGHHLERTELWLAAVGAAVALATPAVLWIRRAVRGAWRNSVSAIRIARTLRRVTAVGLGTLGVGLLALQLTAKLSDATALGPSLRLSLFALAFALGVVASLLTARDS